jgi:hypothetical protein
MNFFTKVHNHPEGELTKILIYAFGMLIVDQDTSYGKNFVGKSKNLIPGF